VSVYFRGANRSKKETTKEFEEIEEIEEAD